MPDTDTRKARCYCGSTASSDNPALAFFEDRRPGSKWALERCRVCAYAPVAHERFAGRLMDTVAAGQWPKGVTPHEFAPSDGHEFDAYYCGCRGWD